MRSPSITNTAWSACVWLWAGIELPASIRIIPHIPPVDSTGCNIFIEMPCHPVGDQARADVSVFVSYMQAPLAAEPRSLRFRPLDRMCYMGDCAFGLRRESGSLSFESGLSGPSGSDGTMISSSKSSADSLLIPSVLRFVGVLRERLAIVLCVHPFSALSSLKKVSISTNEMVDGTVK